MLYKCCTFFFFKLGWFVVEATELFSFSQNHLSTSYCLPLTLKAQQKEKGPYELKITVFPNVKLVPLNVNLVAILLIYFAWWVFFGAADDVLTCQGSVWLWCILWRLHRHQEGGLGGSGSSHSRSSTCSVLKLLKQFHCKICILLQWLSW